MKNRIFPEEFDPFRHFYWVQLDFIQDLYFYNRLARKMLCRSGFWLLGQNHQENGINDWPFGNAVRSFGKIVRIGKDRP
jgi:hypothetical protein